MALGAFQLAAQDDAPLFDEDPMAHTLIPVDELPDPYTGLNPALGGDSTRSCKGIPCAGWVEDLYPDGALHHRGYYGEGRLITYRNHFPNGRVEREFKVQDATRCVMRTYYEDGALRSETRYVDGASRDFKEYYPNGLIRYKEEKHATLPCYTVMDLFAPDGKPVSTLQLVDKKKMVFEQREYWPNGSLRTSGRSQFDRQRHDTRRIGSWTLHDMSGKPVKEERYIEGRVHETAELR